MKTKNFFWTTEFLASFFWIVFFTILIFVNPYRTELPVFLIFFLFLFLAIWTTWGLLEFRLVIKKRGSENIKKKLFHAFRHGLMLSVILVGLLFMKAIDVLTAWDGVIFVLALLLIEGYFWSKE